MDIDKERANWTAAQRLLHSIEGRESCEMVEVSVANIRAALASQGEPVEVKPYGWLTGDSTSHRLGSLMDFTTSYALALEACDEHNRYARQDDPAHVDRVPEPLYTSPPVVAPAQAVDGLNQLQRYDLYWEWMTEKADGTYVKYEDVKNLLKGDKS